jgi:hypothetical protein
MKMATQRERQQAKQLQEEIEYAKYIIYTPIEQLYDDRLVFEGETEKDRALNQFDLFQIREIFQKVAAQLTTDNQTMLLRYSKLCFKTIPTPSDT